MRLVCPNCGAQYEVPDDVIPQDGRDVQCSSCGDTWFQAHPDHEEIVVQDPVPEPPAVPDPEPQPEEAPETQPERSTPPVQPPRQRDLDPSVADVLREEAAREAEARKQEAGTLEEQPDLGLAQPADEATRRQSEAELRKARMRGESAAEAGAAAAMAASGSRRDVLPDIDEINSTLRKDTERRKTASEVAASREAQPKSSGFRRGFLMVLLIAVIAILLYIFAPQIADAVPALSGMLDSYVELVNSARIWLDTQVRGMMGTLDGMASEGAQTPAPEDAPSE